jgi:hypothetical protein
LREETRKDRNMKFLLHATSVGRGEVDILKEHLRSWGNPCFLRCYRSRFQKRTGATYGETAAIVDWAYHPLCFMRARLVPCMIG